MRIRLSDHFNYTKLLRFVFPSIIMMVFTSIYSVVDGFFVSNFAGKTSFAAINLIMPLLMGMGTVGFLIGTGGSAVVSIALGEGKRDDANRYFSMLVYVLIAVGIILTIIGFVFIEPIAYALGARDKMLSDCVIYARILLTFQTAFMLQCAFQSFMVAAEKPKLGLYVTVAAGMTNIILDALFVGLFKWGLVGAAAATVISQTVGGFMPLLYFIRKNDSLLKLIPAKVDWRVLGKVCVNGSSELMTNLSATVVNILYNFQLMKLAGENGVAAYGVIMYVLFIFAAVFFGYSIGCAPIIGYNHGASEDKELHNIFKKSLILISIFGLLMLTASQLLSSPLCELFVGYERELFELTSRGFRIYALSFLISGFNIFASAFFTALGDGVVSAVISFMRTLVFQLLSILLLPVLFDIDGVWFAIVLAELLSLGVSAAFIFIKRKKYRYM